MKEVSRHDLVVEREVSLIKQVLSYLMYWAICKTFAPTACALMEKAVMRIAAVSSVVCFVEPVLNFESSTLKNRFIVVPFVPQKRLNKIVFD
jgi:hypothetical protein